ncbi:hypothetical protein FisN_10Lh298 [Fistulifera solaris]|uniref:Choline transporter-like protein n=1 Tax=Fistulifera solaris TaxID=1519565 RepID=A0A1Z5KGK2_FISSO|nr:hypothetical protein FisN_10Lh298 [Fistulifera solaris]|eukprot:GAX25098.1 hypothetical protein FisN_10Lh298 [Fistulifera solaris]
MTSNNTQPISIPRMDTQRRKSSRSRTNSDEIPHVVQSQAEYVVHHPASAPKQNYFPQQGHHHHHHRTHSWSGGYARPPIAAPPRPVNPLLALQRQYASERHLLHQNNNQHRRTLSSGEYGAFWSEQGISERGSFDNSKQPGFSPRNDFMTLAGGLRGERRRSVTSVSPNMETRKAWRLSPQLSQDKGEAVFLATKKQHPESERKRLLREHTAQMWVEDVKGIPQPSACRDVFFLLLFVFHLLMVFHVGSLYGKETLRAARHAAMTPTDLFGNTTTIQQHEPIDSSLSDGDTVTIYYQNLVFIAMLCGPFTVALSSLMLGVMTLFARFFVQIALVTVLGLSFLWGTVGIYVSPKTVVPVTGVIVLALTVAYTFIVWDRIPFASANLITALRGVHAYPGTIVVAFCFQGLALVYSVYYSIVVFGVYDALKEGKMAIPTSAHFIVYGMLGVSYYWTFQVLLVSSSLEGNIDCRQTCTKNLCRIRCKPQQQQLLEDGVRVLRQLSGFIRPSAADESLLCLHECLHCIRSMLTSCIDDIASNFSSWGFTYVGLYGYGFLDASYNASVLFDKRGWTVIVSDDLVPNILLIVSIVIGGVTGCFAHLISQLDRLHVTSLEEPGLVSFVEGCIIGLVLTSVLFGVISSSVNTVIVCFAASPVDFEQNHPDLSREMRNAWREVWPGALDAIDLRLAMVAGQNGRPYPSPFV